MAVLSCVQFSILERVDSNRKELFIPLHGAAARACREGEPAPRRTREVYATQAHRATAKESSRAGGANTALYGAPRTTLHRHWSVCDKSDKTTQR